MAYIDLRVDYDDIVEQYAANLLTNFMPSLRFAVSLAERQLRNFILPQAVYIMGERAGEGFPRSYVNHLAQAVRQSEIYIDEGSSSVAVTISLGHLGDWEDLELGAHQNAMIADGMDDSDFKSFRFTTKGELKKVTLPYTGEALYNSKERRTEWWNDAIVNRDFHTNVGANWDWVRNQSPENAWSAENVPTFERIASDRVNQAWVPNNVAPEWLLLEYGTPAGTLPVVEPQNFMYNLERVCACALDRIMINAVEEMEEKIASGAVRIKAAGGGIRAPYSTVTGQYLPYVETTVPDLSSCLALL